ncbi:MAG: hypothetical protein H0W50_10740 [Parachlamydiaceae bacterium]|nr:hypothetical protein [Parachlamydiaceae bacterium]
MIAWGAKTAYYARTDGFSLANITSEKYDGTHWSVPPLNASESDEINQALNQEFKYLGKGHQAYVFESQDSRYVLKFIKFQKYRHHPLFAMLPLPESFEKDRSKQTLHKQDKRDALFKSWKIAHTKLKDETLVKFVHIDLSDGFKKTVTIYNRSGTRYDVDLGDYVFLLQKKVDLFEDVLASQMEKGDVADAKELLDGLLDLYMKEFRQGLYEEDRYIVRNTGVLDNKPIQIDTGRLREDEGLKKPKKQAEVILWKTTLLKEWLEETYPELGAHLNFRLGAWQQ